MTKSQLREKKNVTLRSDDATATRTSQTTIVLVGKTTTLLVHFTFFFFAVSVRLRREIA